MFRSSTIKIAVIVLIGSVGGTACDKGGGIGDPCNSEGDCKSALQCLAAVCTLSCADHFDCGLGYLCSDDGRCLVVESEIEDPCFRELDCGPGQACRLDLTDGDGDGTLAATCQMAQPGVGTGTTCSSDADCRNGICSIGQCTQLCSQHSDCPGELACVTIPRRAGVSDAVFAGCLPADGVLTVPLTLSLPYQEIEVPVPSHARSFAVVMEVDDDQLVGAAKVSSPSGRILYATPFSQTEYLDNPIRYQPAERVSTLLVPNSTDVVVRTGIYRIELGSLLSAGGLGTAIPRVSLVYKLDDSETLDLHLYFLNLEQHPCEAEIGGSINSVVAQSDSGFQQIYITAIRSIFADANITIGNITYHDVLDRPDLDSVRPDNVGDLLSLATEETGVSLFFARDVNPVGVQVVTGGIPGPPRIPATSASGIAIGIDTLCYRSWTTMARTTAHAIAQHMGLFDNRAVDGTEDPVGDSPASTDNLMFFSEFGGSSLSAGQIEILHGYPGLR